MRIYSDVSAASEAVLRGTGTAWSAAHRHALGLRQTEWFWFQQDV